MVWKCVVIFWTKYILRTEMMFSIIWESRYIRIWSTLILLGQNRYRKTPLDCARPKGREGSHFTPRGQETHLLLSYNKLLLSSLELQILNWTPSPSPSPTLQIVYLFFTQLWLQVVWRRVWFNAGVIKNYLSNPTFCDGMQISLFTKGVKIGGFMVNRGCVVVNMSWFFGVGILEKR